MPKAVLLSTISSMRECHGTDFMAICLVQLVKKCPVSEMIQLKYPPTSYYSSYLELEQTSAPKRLTQGRTPTHATKAS